MVSAKRVYLFYFIFILILIIWTGFYTGSKIANPANVKGILYAYFGVVLALNYILFIAIHLFDYRFRISVLLSLPIAIFGISYILFLLFSVLFGMYSINTAALFLFLFIIVFFIGFVVGKIAKLKE
jgi:hypothetical protein